MKKGDKECVVRSSGSEKKHLTVVLSASVDGKILPPMIIFKGKTDQSIRNLNIPLTSLSKRKRRLGWMKILCKSESKKSGSNILRLNARG